MAGSVKNNQQAFFSFWRIIAVCLFCALASSAVAQQLDSLKVSSDSLYLHHIAITGAKKTKATIIQRELTVNSGQYYEKNFLLAQLQRSRQNLMNTSLFNFVDLHQETGHDTLYVTIKVTERWYIWPSPIFEYVDPNFNTWLESRDLSRTSYGFQITQYNCRGRNESMRIRAKFGYNEQYSLSYDIPYINKGRKLGMGLYLNYYQNYQVNTATTDNKRLFYTQHDGNAREEFSIGSRFTYRKATYGRNYYSLKFNQVAVADSVSVLYSDYLMNGVTRRQFIELGYQYSYDKRDYSPYPLVGTYYTLSVYKPDISIGKGKQDGLLQLYAQLKKYHGLAKNVFLAYSVSGKYSIYKTMPYYFQRGLGYSDFVRGYEYYVIDAQHYGIIKTSLKYRLLPRREFHIPFIRNEKFNRVFLSSYLNFNLDAGYAVDQLYQNKNFLSNTLLLGTGLGLDLISYYDIVIRCEYSLNKLGQSGFFLHFARPI